MKKAFIIIISLCLAFCLFTFVGCDFAISTDDISNDMTDTNNSSSTNNSATNTNNSTREYYIGETAKNSDNVYFTVTAVQNTTKIGYTNTENNFIIVTIKISNNGTEAWSQNPNNCTLICNGLEYEYSSATYSLDNGMSALDDINPGITKTMKIAFETPSKSTEKAYSIKLSGYSFWTDDSVTIKLQNRA